MKKLLCVLMVVAMLAAAATTAFAATIEVAGDTSVDVKAKYDGNAPADVYNVDVTWGAMQFDYTAAGQKWDAVKHKWVADDEEPAEWTVNNESNTITLTNHSSKAVNATFAFAPIQGYTLSGSFTYNTAALTNALELVKPTADAAATPYVVTFMPSGDLVNTHSAAEYAKIGSITITLG